MTKIFGSLLGAGVLSVVLLAMAFPACASSETFVAVSVGHFHTLALADDGTVWKSGNEYMPGSGEYADASSYIQMPISDVVAVAAGYEHSLALKKDGTVWAWGRNMYGQLGDGSTGDRYVPVEVQGLDNVIAISAGQLDSLALKKDGTVWAWGHNGNGELGDGTNTTRLTPVRVQGLSNITRIMGSCFAMQDDGTVWAWGKALGTNMTVPCQVSWLKGIKALDVDFSCQHVIFVKDDGTVWGWGRNAYGQLGDGSHFSAENPYVKGPVQVKNLKNAIAVSAGMDSSMALLDDGTVWVWGLNGGGQFGTGTTGNIVETPVMVQGLSGVAAISTKMVHSAFLGDDGSVWTCGENGVRNLAAGNSVKTYTGKPVKVLGPGIGGLEMTITPEPLPSNQTSLNNTSNLPGTGSSMTLDNGLFTALLVGTCIVVIIIGGIVFVFKKM